MTGWQDGRRLISNPAAFSETNFSFSLMHNDNDVSFHYLKPSLFMTVIHIEKHGSYHKNHLIALQEDSTNLNWNNGKSN